MLWLLEQVSPSCGPLVGDLLEERHRGRSRAWLCRQTLSAIAVSCARQLRAHGLLAAAAVLTGWLFVWVAGLADSIPIPQLPGIRLSRLLTGLVYPNAVDTGLLFDASYAVGLILLSVASGWLVTALYRPLGLAAVLTYCASFSLFGAYRMLVHAAGWFPGDSVIGQGPVWATAPWSGFLMLKVALYFPLFSAGILLGGYLATRVRPECPRVVAGPAIAP